MPKTITADEAQGQAIARLRVIKKLAPHARGAKALTAQYGDDLVCVRHRMDASGRRRLTTVELVVGVQAIRRQPSPLVDVKVQSHELTVRARLMAAGAKWNPRRQTWRLRRATAMLLGLKCRIQDTD